MVFDRGVNQIVNQLFGFAKEALEPTTSWSRTRFQPFAKSIEFCRKQPLLMELLVGTALKSIEFN
jgi:hypothetical protein